MKVCKTVAVVKVLVVAFVNGFQVSLGMELDVVDVALEIVVVEGFQCLIGLNVVATLLRTGGRVLRGGSCGPGLWIVMEDIVV